MARARYKITFVFKRNNMTATESYITPNADDSTQTDRLRNLMLARLNLLYEGVRLDGIRVAQIADAADTPVKRASKYHRPGLRYPFLIPDANGMNGVSLTIPGQGAQAGSSDWFPDVDGTDAVVRLSYGGNRATNRYMAFWPDAGLDSNPPGASVTTVMLPFWQAWVSRVRTDGWSIVARNQSGDFRIVPILKWVSSGATPALLGVQVTATGAPPFAPPLKVAIQNTRRRGTDKTSYNGQYVIDSVLSPGSPAPMTVFLASTEAGDATSIKKPGQVQLVGSAFIAIDFLEVVLGGSHKRGNSAGARRGNRRKRALLDP